MYTIKELAGGGGGGGGVSEFTMKSGTGCMHRMEW